MDKKKIRLPLSGNQLVLILALIGVTVVFSLLNPNYFTYTNLINVLVSSTNIGLTAIGITFLIMTGGNDLSAGSVAAFAGVFVAWSLKSTGLPWPLLCLAAIAVSALAGPAQRPDGHQAQHRPLHRDAGSQSVWRGFAYLLCDGKPVSVADKSFMEFGKGRLGGDNGIPYPVIMTIILFVIFGYILAKTKFGRSIFAIGGNAEAARLAGINANRVKTLCYIMTSMFAALAGIILAARMNSGQPAANPNLHFDAITAANLGGRLDGRRRRFDPQRRPRRAAGAGFNSGLNMVGVSSYWQYVARGMLLFASLAIDFYRQRSRTKKLLADSMKAL